MNFNVLLIRPNICVRKPFDLLNKMYPPIGLAYLAGALQRSGFSVEILDMVAAGPGQVWDYRGSHRCFGMTDQDLVQHVRQERPGLIGITGFTKQHARIVEITAALKQGLPDIKIVLGGVHASALPEFLMQQSKADYLLQGESESSLVELANALKRGEERRIEEIDGIVYRSSAGIILKPKRSHEDMPKIPNPAWQLFPNADYLAEDTAMPIITSRGCPNHCAFCCVHLTQSKRWRSHDPIRVVDEIEIINKELGYRLISIFDDAFNVRPDRAIAICREIVRRKLDIELLLPGGLMLRWVTRDLLYWLKTAGCMAVSLPFEHADDHMRNEVICKGVDAGHFQQVLQWCRELNLLNCVNFVLGMPGETKETLEKVVTFVQQNAFKIDVIQPLVATPFPGTRFYDDCLRKGYLVNPAKNDFLDFDLYSGLIDTPDLKREEVEEHKQKILRVFDETRGDFFSSDDIRRIFRKPEKSSRERLEHVYLNKRNELWDQHQPAAATHGGEV